MFNEKSSYILEEQYTTKDNFFVQKASTNVGYNCKKTIFLYYIKCPSGIEYQSKNKKFFIKNARKAESIIFKIQSGFFKCESEVLKAFDEIGFRKGTNDDIIRYKALRLFKSLQK